MIDEFVDQPVWHVVNWATGVIADGPNHLAVIRMVRAGCFNIHPEMDWRIARWDDGRWIEVPKPETAREVLTRAFQVIPLNARREGMADHILAALSGAGFEIVRREPTDG